MLLTSCATASGMGLSPAGANLGAFPFSTLRMAATGGTLWVPIPNGALARVDESTNRLVISQPAERLAEAAVDASSGGGVVKVTARCDGTIAAIKIDPQTLNPSDAQLLEDMILTATNQALAQAKEVSNSEMGKVTAGMGIPGLM